MNNIKILIVEDEPLIADDLAFTLKDIGYGVAGVCMCGKEALEVIDSEEVDLILMDINIEGDMDGISLAEEVNKLYDIPIIYLTSYSDKSTLERAKKTKPLAYLVKPINEKDLLTTIEIAINNYQENQHIQIASKPQSDSIFVKESYIFYKLKIKDILFVEAYDNYSFVYTSSKKFLISNTLKILDDRLKLWDFVRVHRSFLVNPEVISKIEGSYIYILDHKIPISKKYRKGFLDGLDIL